MLSFQVLYAQEGRLENVNIIETWLKERGDVEIAEKEPDFYIYLHLGGRIKIIERATDQEVAAYKWHYSGEKLQEIRKKEFHEVINGLLSSE